MVVLRWLFALGCLGLAPAGWAATPDIVRVAVLAPRGLGTTDPHLATAHYDRMVASWTHGALVRFRPGSINPAEIEPDLAERWDVSPDRLVWTFHLRPGVRFHRGAGPVTADDVAFSLQKVARAETSAYAGDYADIAAIEAVDPLTLRVVLHRPVPFLLGVLTNYAGGFIVARQDPAIGFGPFVLEPPVPGQPARLSANTEYVRGAPRLRGIELVFVGALSTGDLAFDAGEVDIVEGQQDQAWINRRRQSPDTVVDVIDPAEISWLHLNGTQPPLDDPRVRQAVALAVNRPELVAWRGADLARAVRGVIPAAYLGFASDVALPTTDIPRARQLLAEAGYPNGVTIPTVHTGNPTMLNAMQVVQAQLRRAGITLAVKVVDHQSYHQMIRQDLSPLVHYAAARFPVADAMLTPFFHGRSTVGRPGGVTNFSHCAVADDVLDLARTEADGERQLALWAEAQRRIIAANCAVPLLETRQVWARRARFEYGFPFNGAMATGPLLTEQSGFRP